jgi:hypothetical protein
MPPPAREAGQHWPRRRATGHEQRPLAGSADAQARCTASGRCGGFAQSCGWRLTSDRRRSDLCSRHHQGSCGRLERVLLGLEAKINGLLKKCSDLALTSRRLRSVGSYCALTRIKDAKIGGARRFKFCPWWALAGSRGGTNLRGARSSPGLSLLLFSGGALSACSSGGATGARLKAHGGGGRCEAARRGRGGRLDGGDSDARGQVDEAD